MALEIKPTPILTGESADRFLQIIAETGKKRITREEKEEMERKLALALKKAKI